MPGERIARVRRAATRLLRIVYFVDNGTCSICHGYWPREHHKGCEGKELRAAIRALGASGEKAGESKPPSDP
jgi:hypothetical protein